MGQTKHAHGPAILAAILQSEQGMSLTKWQPTQHPSGVMREGNPERQLCKEVGPKIDLDLATRN